jgi:MazG family protein
MNLQATYDWDGLRRVCRTLRGPGGCNWDRAQTLATLTPYVLEETHEFLEAVTRGDAREIAEEMGDLLYLLVFMLTIAEEESRFDFRDVARAIIEKMIRRHPHVFGPAPGELRPDEVSEQWESIKKREREEREVKPSGRLAGGARSLPALLDAFRVQEKAASMGFDWPGPDGVLTKLDEETQELRAALRGGGAQAGADVGPSAQPPAGPAPSGRELHPRVAEEIGDLLFTLVNLARHLRGDPEQLLRRSTRKFQHRFGLMEQILEKRGTTLEEADLETMEDAWQQAKRQDTQPAEGSAP